MIISGTKALNDCQINDKECQKIYDKARAIEPLITKDMVHIAEELGGRMHGLKYSVKEASHVEKKLEQKAAKQITKQGFAQSNVENMKNVGDLVRYTFISKAYAIPNNTQSFINELEKRGYVITEVDNKYINPHPDTGYKGIHINAIHPSGQKFELQVHSDYSLSIKNKGHQIYKKIQDVKTSEDIKDLLKEKVKEVHSSVRNPLNIENIKSYKLDTNIVLKELKNNNKYNYEIAIASATNANGEVEFNSKIIKNGNEIEIRLEAHKKDGGVAVEEKVIGDTNEEYNSFTIDNTGKIIEKSQVFKDIKDMDVLDFNKVLEVLGDPPPEVVQNITESMDEISNSEFTSEDEEDLEL